MDARKSIDNYLAGRRAAVQFCIWRLRVSLIASTKYGWRFGFWGFCDDDFDRVAFDDGMTPDDYFIEAWGRE